MNLGVLAKSIVIAVCAGFAASAYLAGFDHLVDDQLSGRGILETMIIGAVALSVMLGLPIALLVFWMAHKHLVQSPNTLAMIALLAGIMMVLASFVIGERQGVILLGVPASIAAVTYALLGWLWILKPMGKDRNA